MKKIKVVTLLFIITTAALAQTAIKPLKIGEKVPDLYINDLINTTKPAIKLNALTGKILIIDFWATTCGGCIDHMPRLQQLQDQFKDEITILPVTFEKKTYVAKYMRVNRILRGITMPVVTNDNQFKKLFPHQLLGYIVWIVDGKYAYATSEDYITGEAIKKVLDDPAVNWHQRYDVINFNYKRPLFSLLLNKQLKGVKPVYSSDMEGYIEGLPYSAGAVKDSSAQTKRLYRINHPLLNMYAMALNSGLPYQPNRRIIDGQDSDRFIYSQKQGYRSDWERRNSLSYENTVPLGASDKEGIKKLKSDLDIYLGVSSGIEPVEVNCIALKIKSAGLLKAGRSSEHQVVFHPDSVKNYFHQARIEDLCWGIDKFGLLPPVFDETGNKETFDLDLKYFPKTVEELSSALEPYGIEVVKEKRTIAMFVIKRDNP